jgi:hypothetical protein
MIMPSKQVTIMGVMTWEGEGGGSGDSGLHPSHPIMGPGIPTHPIAGPPPGIWPSPGVPTHPIVIPPDAIAPGVPTHPIVLPGDPTHPIVIPGTPTHPIVIPPSGGVVVPPAVGVPTEYLMYFSPTYGYVLVPQGSGPAMPPAPPA